MNFPLLTSVLEDPSLTTSQRLVLVIMLNHAGDSERAWPSQATIAKQAGLTERSVCSIVNELRSLGWLVRTGNVGRTGVFKVCVPETVSGYHETISPYQGAGNHEAISGNHEITSLDHETISGPSRNSFILTTQEPPIEPLKNHPSAAKAQNGKLVEPEFLPEDDPVFVEVMTEWFRYKREKRQSYTTRGWKACLAIERRYPLAHLRASVQTSMARNWQGLFTSKITDAEAAVFETAAVHALQPEDDLMALMRANIAAQRAIEEQAAEPPEIAPDDEGGPF